MIFQGGSETMMVLHPQAQVELYHDNSKKFETTSSGATVTGSLGVGTTSPASPLHLHESSSGSIEGLKVTNSTTGTGLTDGLSIGLQSDEDVFIHNYENTAIHFGTNDTTRLSILAGGDVEVIDGNLKFASGHGIDFSSTSNAGGMTSELLNDYEEGTYTPNVQTNNGVNAGVSTAFGSYVKVGTLVTVHIGVTTNSHSGVDTSAQYRVYLPFTAANQSGVGTEGNLICSQWSIGSQNISWMGGEVQNGFNFIYMHYHNGSNNNTNNLTPSAASNELHFRGTCVYRAAS